MATELTDLLDPESVTRKIFEEKGYVDISEYEATPYEIPSEADVQIHNIVSPRRERRKLKKEINQIIKPVMEEASEKGYPPQLETALYEAILNAHQHGNKEDPNKNITTVRNINEDNFLFSVIDEGGIIEAPFIPYLQSIKQANLKKNFVNYYDDDFSLKNQPETNIGTGTSFMHLYTDQVNYYKSKERGLVVEMKKDKQ